MDIEKEIELVNDMIANAIIHGADLGGTYDQNEKELTKAINKWIKAKGLENEYHVAKGTYLCLATDDEYPDFAPSGYWSVMKICKKVEKHDKFKWVNNDIKINFPIPKVMRYTMAGAEQYDMENNRSEYNAVAETIALMGKEGYEDGLYTKEQWEKLCERYPYV